MVGVERQRAPVGLERLGGRAVLEIAAPAVPRVGVELRARRRAAARTSGATLRASSRTSKSSRTWPVSGRQRAPPSWTTTFRPSASDADAGERAVVRELRAERRERPPHARGAGRARGRAPPRRGRGRGPGRRSAARGAGRGAASRTPPARGGGSPPPGGRASGRRRVARYPHTPRNHRTAEVTCGKRPSRASSAPRACPLRAPCAPPAPPRGRRGRRGRGGALASAARRCSPSARP